MRSKCLVLAAELEGAPPEGVDADETALAIRFLRWMADDHFTFLGFRDYTLRQTAEGEFIAPITGSGLGLLRSDPPLGHDPDLLTPQASAKAHEPNILVLTKANTRSTVHRVDPPRLRRREAVRRGRPGGRRAPVPGALRLHRLHRVGDARAAGRREGARRARALGRGPRQPHRQGPARGARELPARRADPGQRRAALRDRDVGDPAAGAAPHQAVHPRGRLRPLRVLPGLHPARPLQHQRAAADGRHPQGHLRRRVRRVLGAGQRVGPVPAAVRRAGAQGQAGAHPRPRRAGRPRAPARRGQPHLERPARRRPARRPRRGGGRPPHGPVRARLPDRLRGDLHASTRAWPTSATSTGSATAPAPAWRSTGRPTPPTTCAGSSCSASTR